MVVCTLAATWLAFITVATALACPWMTTTRKGLLFLHWVVANVIDSSLAVPSPVQPPSPCSLLVPLATIALIFEIAAMAGGKERRCVGGERLLFLSLLISIDLSVLLTATAARFEVTLGILCLLGYLGIYLCFKRVRSPHDMSMKERYDLHSSDLFYAWEDPLMCLGSLGRLHYFSILTGLLMQVTVFLSSGSNGVLCDFLASLCQMMPAFVKGAFIPGASLLLWLLFVCRSICSLAMITTPTFFGGFTHAMKTFGRWVAARREKRKNSEARDDLLENVVE